MKKVMKNSYDKMGEDYYKARKYKTGASYFYNENVEMPATFEFLGNAKGKKILDLGCGPGFHSKILIKKGAKVKGIDFSKELIKIARLEVPEVKFEIGNVEKLPYKKGEFDVVISSLVLNHLKSWDKVLKEVGRVLKKKGIFIFSISNPFMKSSKKIKWFGREFRVIKDYFKEQWITGNWGTDKKPVKSAEYHKTYESIINDLIKHNFEILGYKDPKPKKEIKKKFPKQYNKYLNFPNFCVWKVRKK